MSLLIIEGETHVIYLLRFPGSFRAAHINETSQSSVKVILYKTCVCVCDQMTWMSRRGTLICTACWLELLTFCMCVCVSRSGQCAQSLRSEVFIFETFPLELPQRLSCSALSSKREHTKKKLNNFINITGFSWRRSRNWSINQWLLPDHQRSKEKKQQKNTVFQ